MLRHVPHMHVLGCKHEKAPQLLDTLQDVLACHIGSTSG